MRIFSLTYVLISVSLTATLPQAHADEVNYDDPNMAYRPGFVSDRLPKLSLPPLNNESPTSTLDLPPIAYGEEGKTVEKVDATPTPKPKKKQKK